CCDPKTLGFETTAEFEPLSGALGQEEAMKALAFGVSVASKGYNIFALGRAGSGRRTFIQRELENRAEKEPTPSSWCYGFNFKEPRNPVALELPAGSAKLLRARLDALVTDLKRAIPQALEADDVTNRRAAIYEDRGREATAAMEAFRKGVEDDSNVALIGAQDGMVVVPAQEGEPVTKEAYEVLPEEVRQAIDETVRDASKKLFQTQRRMHELQREASGLADDLHRQVTRSVVEHRFSILKEFYNESPRVLRHLDETAEDVVENWEKFTATDSQTPDGPQAMMGGPPPEDFFVRYRVNPIVTRDRNSGAPVIIESNPNLWTLTGRIEGQVRFGVMVTDFTKIAPGAFHRANGGYLILHAEELLSRPLAWTALKRTLRTRELRPEDPAATAGMMVPETLEPEPIPLNVKVILIGEPSTYYRLQQADPEFEELFKVKVDFTPHMDRTPEAEKGYASFVAARCEREGLPAFDATAVAAVVEEGSRLASNQWKLSTRFRAIRDLVREAAHVAGGNESEVVSRAHVEGAMRDRHLRNNRPHRELLDLIKRGVLSFEPVGIEVGQIHGIGLIQVSDEAFGRPIRVMCSAYLGTDGVTNIEREALMSGRIHSKGFLILQGYLGRTFARSKPLLLSASLSFDQLYEEIEGDSASAAELYALLSAISGVPLRQDICITGAINQDGRILPVGGVTEKVEGVFSAFEQLGFTGKQGVIVPRRNVENLVLRRRVRDAVAEGDFHIYAIDRIEEGWPILTGLEAGQIQKDETFPSGTVHSLVGRQLDEFVREWSSMGSEEQGPEQEEPQEESK
ncbi:MAG: AAA family ATPase, partial [Gemmatimonadetes bacterium]|nr:AAA family ATPase [Gemmatimonadota bacterium]